MKTVVAAYHFYYPLCRGMGGRGKEEDHYGGNGSDSCCLCGNRGDQLSDGNFTALNSLYYDPDYFYQPSAWL